MLPAERRKKILAVLDREGKIEVDSLAKELAVSTMTVRRDLAFLAKEGRVLRTHGGAIIDDGLLGEIPYKSKEITNIKEKQKIGKAAAGLVKEGQILILDSGTTTLEIAKNLYGFKDLTVITNDLKIALELSNYGIKVFSTGGQVQEGLGTLLGSTAENFIAGIKVDITFLATSSIDLNWGITSPNLDKASIKKRMIRAADSVVVVADHSKFGKKAFAQIASIEDVDLLVTDSGVEEQDIAQLKELGPDVLTV